jgi:hypothetical protein
VQRNLCLIFLKAAGQIMKESIATVLRRYCVSYDIDIQFQSVYNDKVKFCACRSHAWRAAGHYRELAAGDKKAVFFIVIFIIQKRREGTHWQEI